MIRERLRLLRMESGCASNRQAISQHNSVSQRIKRLRPAAAQHAHKPKTISDDDVAGRLGGVVFVEGVVMVERQVSLGQRHGVWPLHLLPRLLGTLPEHRDTSAERLLFVDTETTGLAGGTGTLVFLLGVAQIQGQALVIRQYLLTRFAGECMLLKEAGLRGESMDGVVTYNGKSFDIPLLSARCRLAGVKDQLSRLRHIDLLYPVRRAFKDRWKDCSLNTAERKLLKFYRREDLPGAAAPQAWFDFIKRSDIGRLSAVLKHNYYDLLSLAALLPAISRVYQVPQAMAADTHGIARVYIKHNEDRVALSLLLEGRARLSEEGLLELARLLKRERRWEAAREIWLELAERENNQAIEELAKYHEHIVKDYSTALHYTERLIPGDKKQHRKRRLQICLHSKPLLR